MRHSHSIRRTMLLVVSVTLASLVVGIPTAAPADLQNVTLTCSDGTNLNLALDVASVMQLTDAVNAMALNPAGDPPLTCGVVTASSLSSGNPTYDYVVGGGKAPNLGCFGGYPPVPFGLSAHVGE